ncbi:TonB-dependent receptor [Sulfurimonas sp.]|nr:TonB-dependent receptor [Sulfurimonas sp.]
MYKNKILLSMLASSILVAQNVELSQITVISATKTAQSIEDVTSNVNVITAQEIQEKKYTTVVQAINSVPGISYTQQGPIGQATNVYLRGLDSKRTLVMIDGIRYNDVTGISGAPFAELMVSDIEQIEIIKGAQSGVWGADASAGVINIITKSAKKGLHGSMNLEYGSFDTKKYGASASYKADNYYIKASSQIIDTDGFSAKATAGQNINDFEDDWYKNITTNLKFGFNIDKNNKVDISHTMIYANGEYDSGANDSRETKTEDSFTKINFNHKNDYTEVDVYAKMSIFNRDYPQGFTKQFDGVVHEYGIKTNTSYNDEDFFVLGYDYKKFEFKNSIQETYNNEAVFLTNSNQFNNVLGKTIITESLRFDHYNKFDDAATGKFGVKHFIKDLKDTFISANIGTSYNVPALYHLYDSWAGSTNLTPEDTTSYDVTLGYKDFQLTYFNSSIQDMIDYNNATNKYYNAQGKTKINGVELEYKTNLNDETQLSSSYTWLNAKDSSGMTLQRRPKHSVKLGLDYYGVKNLHVGAYGEYIGKRIEYTYNTYNVSAQTGNYTVVNLVSNYDISKNVQVYAKIDNLFDKQYQEVSGYATAPLSAYVGMRASF